MSNLKKIFKSKTFYIPALSCIGIIVLLFIGACLESIKIFPTGDMSGLFSWALIFASLPIIWLQRPLMSVSTFIHFKFISGALVIASLIFYHLLIGFMIGFLINFIYCRLKSQKPLDIYKISESQELEPSKQELIRRKSSTQKIVLIILGAIAVLGLAMLAWTFLDKSSPISKVVCQQKVKQTTEAIKQANYCVEDNDCATVKSWVCGNDLVNKEKRNEMEQSIKALNRWCVPPPVICPEPPLNFKCLNSKCEFVEEKTEGVDEFLDLKEQVNYWIAQLNSSDKVTISKAVRKLMQLAYKDIEETEIKRAVPKLRELLKIYKNIDDGPSFAIIETLSAIGDKSAIMDLQIIALSGPHIRGELQTEAGMAAGAIETIKYKRQCLDKLKNLAEAEKNSLLLDAVKHERCHIPNELTVNFLIDAGKPAVPKMLDMMEEAMLIDINFAKGIHKPYDPTSVYYLIPRVLGAIGDPLAISILEKVATFQQNRDPGRLKTAQEALQSIRNQHPELIIADYNLNPEKITQVKEIVTAQGAKLAGLYQDKFLFFIRDNDIFKYDLESDKTIFLALAPEFTDAFKMKTINDKIWIGTKSQILRYDPALDKWSDYKFKLQEQDSILVGADAEIIAFDVNKDFLAVGINTKTFYEPGVPTETWTPRSNLFGGGIYLTNIATQAKEYINKQNGFPGDNGWEITFDQDGNIWSFVRSVDDQIISLAFYSIENKEWKLFNDKEKSFPQKYNEVYSIFPHAEGVFITTDAGLYQISNSTHQVQSLKNSDYELSGGFYKIYAIFDNQLLATSENSQDLNLLNLSTNKIVKILSLKDQKIHWVNSMDNNYYIGTEKSALNIKLK